MATILIIDDEPVIRSLLVSAFETDHLVIEAGDGQEGIALYGLHEPDLVITDFKLPGMNGLAVVRHLRSLSNQVKIIGFSSCDASTQAELLEAGINLFFAKSGKITELEAAISSLLSEKAASSGHTIQMKSAGINPDQLGSEVTALRQRVAELEFSKTQADLLMSFSPVGIFHTDGDGKCWYTNPKCQTMTGLSPEESLGDGWVDALHPEDRERVLAEWERSVGARKEFLSEFRYLKSQGVMVWVRCHAVPIFSETGAILGFTGTHEDITEYKAIECLKNELAEANRKLKEMDKIKSNFTAMLAHDLKSPLTVVKATLSFLEDSTNFTPEEIGEFVEASRSSVDKVLGLIKDMLDVFRSEHEDEHLTRHRLDTELLLRGCGAEAEVMAVAKGITVQIEVAPDLPDIFGDETKLERVFSNLLSNAVKYTPPQGVIKLEAWLRLGTGVEEGLRLLVVNITDTGEGIAPEDVPYVFDPYRQAEKNRNVGVGLGLAIVKRIVAAHGGNITVRSQLGVGTCFSVVLPIYE